MFKNKFTYLLNGLLSLVLVVTLVAPLSQGVQAEESASQETVSEETVKFTDDLGREVELPAKLDALLSTGPTSQIVLYTLAPERMVGWNRKPANLDYLPEEADQLPEVGSLFARGQEINLEEVIKLNPDVIVDLGERKDGIEEDLDQLQEQTGIPVIFFDGQIQDMPNLYRKLGDLLEVDTTEQVAYLEETLNLAQDKREQVQANPLTYYFASGDNGLTTAASSSFQAEVIELVGLHNVYQVDEAKSWEDVSMEQVVEWNPETVIFLADSAFDQRDQEPWVSLEAGQANRIYESPDKPFNWLTGPKSVNAILGIKWLGNLYYPDLYDLDMVQEAQTFYDLFYHYDLSEEEAKELMKHSTFLNN
ncbi:ABC transporter substrate-binding protein [Hutsoniella sourekii]|uniref:ABC transporter substrate-binding protein n=1 Tax=Hutsoniella sourekii TaxID=87650 RepID=UPI0004B24689|nr:ABC transporter substrate-binding protein [Hutsoniella sourekii]